MLAQNFGASARLVIVSVDSRYRWRVTENGRVEQSSDGGASWESQQTGVSAALAAGASPAPSVCWIVGGGGTVVLSLDRRSWQAVPFPESVDLVAVAATDDSTATVTARDGRRFRTTNRGVTWTPLRND
jgi:photosystem II stability/assembly factor-like uncharacterized protein